MLSIEDCKGTLNKDRETFTDEEIKTIRDYLYKMAKIVSDEYTKNSSYEEI